MSCLILSPSFSTLFCTRRRKDRTATTGRLPNQQQVLPAAQTIPFRRTVFSCLSRGERTRRNPALTPVNFLPKKTKMIAARGSVVLLIALMLSSAFSQELWSQTRVKRDKGGHHHQVGWPLSISFFFNLFRLLPETPPPPRKKNKIFHIRKWKKKKIENSDTSATIVN